MDDNDVQSNTENPDQLPFIEQEVERHPSPSIRLLREAIDKTLMRDQKELWEMYAYDKTSPAEIARKLKTSKSNISQRIAVIERKIIQYCKDHQEVYETLKEAEDNGMC